MNEVIDNETGEVVEVPVAAALATLPKANEMDAMVKATDLPLLRVMEQMDTLDWKNLKPHQTAFLLMQRPFPVSGGGSMSLTFKQAIIFATRCYELNLSPFSSEVWFDPNRSTVNLTLEGKKAMARNLGLDIGPPQFEEISRSWADVPKIGPAGEAAKKAGFTKDVGIKCRMRVGDPKNSEFVEYHCWLSEWYVEKSPVWQQKYTHMLQTRATEKAISLVMGTGASEAITD